MSLPDSARLELKQGLERLGLAGEEQTLRLLQDYAELLLKWNAAYNLIAEADTDSMVARHLLDSLSIQPFISGTTIVDVGSGAGLPGIPLAIVNPDKHFVLVDSNGKKTRFLFQVKTELGLGNISVENCRIEHYQSPEQIDIVMCRAFSSLKDVVSKTQHLLSATGKLLAMKGRYPQEEIDELPREFTVTEVTKLAIPDSDSERHLIAVARSEQTSKPASSRG